MPVVFIVAAGVAIAVGVTTNWYDRIKAAMFGTEGVAAVPDSVVRAVLAVKQRKATPDLVRTAALEAAQAGHLSLGQALADEAATLTQLQAFVSTVASSPEGDCVHYLSPLPEISADAWTTYVRRSRVARPGAVTPQYRLGAYGLNARELEDAGLMRGAHKGTYEGRRGVWIGDWAEGRSEEQFLASPAQQYEALVELTKLHAKLIATAHGDAIGKELEGEPATLSGLLAVARRAGRGGLKGWVNSAEERKAFPETTAAYRLLNGIF